MPRTAVALFCFVSDRLFLFAVPDAAGKSAKMEYTATPARQVRISGFFFKAEHDGGQGKREREREEKRETRSEHRTQNATVNSPMPMAPVPS